MNKIYAIVATWAFAFTCILPAQIIPTEIMYNPPESGQDSLEYIEIYNSSDQDINLEGYTFSAGVDLTFGDLTIPAESYFLLANDDTVFLNTMGVLPDAIWGTGALSNGGELIELQDSNGIVIFSLTYDDADPWPTSPDGEGASLELCDLERDYTDPSSWGAANTSTGVVINGIEIKGTPRAVNNTDCGASFDHRVEVRSNSFTPADLTINVGETVLWDNVDGEHNVDGRQQTYPGNPESFYSGEAADAPWEYTFTFNTEGSYQYECTPHAALGMIGSITVIDPNQLPLYEIATVTTNDQNGIPDSLGVGCVLRGIIHGANRRGGGYEFALIDMNGDGITVFSSNEIGGYAAQEGDMVEVEGYVGQFNGTTQLNAVEITLLSSGNALLEPEVVTTLGEDTESEYIMIENVEFVDPSEWQQGSSFNMQLLIKSTNEVVTLRIDSDVPLSDLSEPPVGGDGSPFTIRGIGGQFDNDEPFFEGYQIFPSFEEDFMQASSASNVYSLDAKIFPNPVINNLHLRGLNTNVQYLQILDQTGQLVKMVTDVGPNMQINLNSLSAGSYFIITEIAGDLYYQRFIKQ